MSCLHIKDKVKKKGKRKKCKVYGINKIKDNMKKILEENIKYLEKISKGIKYTIDGLKNYLKK